MEQATVSHVSAAADPFARPKPLNKQTLFLQLALGILVLTGLGAVGAGIWLIGALNYALEAEIPRIMLSTLTEESVFLFALLVMLVAWIVSAIPYSFWVYRANKNAHLLGAEGMKHTPGWAVGWTFIPFANLLKPYFVLDELWKASKDTSFWQAQPSSQLIGWIWVFLIAGGILSRVGTRFFESATTYDGQILSVIALMLSTILLTTVVIFFMVFVTKVKRLQALQMRSAGYY
jgi:Domain of unknown function (DUF4328)